MRFEVLAGAVWNFVLNLIQVGGASLSRIRLPPIFRADLAGFFTVGSELAMVAPFGTSIDIFFRANSVRLA
jgi:hypothetical protein